MEEKKPLVSVIVRTKDRPILLKKALQSVAGQAYRPLEVVLVNDGGLDLDPAELREVLGNIVLRHTKLDRNTGRAHAGNIGIEMAQGEYICFLDDDDIFSSDHINILLNVLEEFDYQAAYTDAFIIYRDFNPRTEQISEREKKLFTSKDFSYEELLADNYIPLICVMFRSRTLKAFRGFDENFELYEDWDLLLRIGEKYPFYHIPKVTAEYVQWSNSLQISQSPMFFNKAAAYHNQIIVKHRSKYSSDIIRGLVQSRRELSARAERIQTLELKLGELQDNTVRLGYDLRAGQERIAWLEQNLQDSVKKGAELESTVRRKDEYITGLGAKLEELHRYSTSLEQTGIDKEAEITVLRNALNEKNLSLSDAEDRIKSLEDAIVKAGDSIAELSGKIGSLEKTILENSGTIQKNENTISALEKHIAGLKDVINERDLRLIEFKRTNFEKEAGIFRLEEQIQQKNSYITQVEAIKNRLESAVREKDAELTRIHNSNGWKGLLLYYKLRDKILPRYTRRRAMVKTAALSLINLLKKNNSSDTDPATLSMSQGSGATVGSDTRLVTSSNGNNSDKTNPLYVTVSGTSENETSGKKRVLVAGIYLANQGNTVEHLIEEINSSENYSVVQKWVALFGEPPSKNVDNYTSFRQTAPAPKFVLLNKILSEEKLHLYDYILFCDDDIRLGNRFLDSFLGFQEKYDFALAQPARTHNSFIDHHFVEQLDGLSARRTRFVEIGPVFSIRRDAFPVLLPFDESSLMGWGYDFVWPCFIEKMGLRMGIIDAVPVDHSLRKPVINYNYDEANKSMLEYLSRSPHLSKDEAFRILESYVQ